MKFFSIMPSFLKLTVVIGMGLLLASCSGNKAESNVSTDKEPAGEHADETMEVSLTPEQKATAGIETAAITTRTLSGTIKANGTLDVPPQQLVSIAAPMGGFLKSSDLLQGKHVNKGAIIAIMQDPAYIQLQQDYLESISQLEYLQADLERQETLAKENINAQKALQLARSQYQTMQAKVKGLTAKLRLININTDQLKKGEIQSTINLYAPISGYVTEVNVNIGKYVSPTDIMFEIVDTEHLHAELTVFEKDVPKLKIGQKVRFLLANETKERMATVYLIGREISADRTVRIHCHLDREDKELLPGMYLTAYVETKNMQLPALPEPAVVSYEGKQYIFIDEGKEGNEWHYKAMEIKTGVAELGYVELVLPPNFDVQQTKVVTKGAYDLLSKWKSGEAEEGHGH